MLGQFVELLLVRVFGHYAHPYAITLTLRKPSLPFQYSMQETIKFIGSHSGAVDVAKQHLRAGHVAHAVVSTRSGVTIWEGTA